MHLFTPVEVREVTARNRVMLSPMCQYSCEAGDGLATDWHRVHLGSRAVGGAGIVMTEATAVTPRGRISPQDLGIWSDAHAEALSPAAAFVADHGAVPAIQLAHAGRKASKRRPADGSDPIHGDGGAVAPRGAARNRAALDRRHHRARRRLGGRRRARRRRRLRGTRGPRRPRLPPPRVPLAGDQHREDAYGGDFEGRTRLLREVVDAVPGSVPLFVRTSATDWLPDRESWTVDDSARLAADLGPLGVDLVDVSAGGVHPDQEGPDTGSHYQVPYAERVAESGVPAGAVGGIATPEGADAIVRNDRADLVVVGREHLRDPYFAIRAAQQLGHEAPVPQQYTRGFE